MYLVVLGKTKEKHICSDRLEHVTCVFDLITGEPRDEEWFSVDCLK